MRSQGEDPNHGSEVGRHGLLVASNLDPQGLVLDHLKLIQVGRGYLGEPDIGGVGGGDYQVTRV